MKAMTVEEIQDVSLRMLKHIKEFCAEHKIRWWLSDGTLLGAIRHHGFIPWDDDTDISMPRPDYDRFLKEYVDSEKYKLYAPERGNSYMTFARVCEMKETQMSSKALWTYERPGVCIDILPLDGCSSDEKEYLDSATQIVEARKRLIAYRRSFSPITFRHSPMGFAKDVVHAVGNLLRRLTIQWAAPSFTRKIREIRTRFDYASSVHCTTVIGWSNLRKRWLKRWFETLVEVDFCGERFPVPVGYDGRLTAEYGDYMTPPPKSEQMVHAGWQTMWWRNK